MIIAPSDEFEASSGLNLNVLPTSSGRCIMIDGFPKTKQAMEEKGIHVDVFEGDVLCMACEGAPTCLTSSMLRTYQSILDSQGE